MAIIGLLEDNRRDDKICIFSPINIMIFKYGRDSKDTLPINTEIRIIRKGDRLVIGKDTA